MRQRACVRMLYYYALALNAVVAVEAAHTPRLDAVPIVPKNERKNKRRERPRRPVWLLKLYIIYYKSTRTDIINGQRRRTYFLVFFFFFFCSPVVIIIYMYISCSRSGEKTGRRRTHLCNAYFSAAAAAAADNTVARPAMGLLFVMTPSTPHIDRNSGIEKKKF